MKPSGERLALAAELSDDMFCRSHDRRAGKSPHLRPTVARPATGGAGGSSSQLPSLMVDCERRASATSRMEGLKLVVYHLPPPVRPCSPWPRRCCEPEAQVQALLQLLLQAPRTVCSVHCGLCGPRSSSLLQCGGTSAGAGAPDGRTATPGRLVAALLRTAVLLDVPTSCVIAIGVCTFTLNCSQRSSCFHSFHVSASREEMQV